MIVLLRNRIFQVLGKSFIVLCLASIQGFSYSSKVGLAIGGGSFNGDLISKAETMVQNLGYKRSTRKYEHGTTYSTFGHPLKRSVTVTIFRVDAEEVLHLRYYEHMVRQFTPTGVEGFLTLKRAFEVNFGVENVHTEFEFGLDKDEIKESQ